LNAAAPDPLTADSTVRCWLWPGTPATGAHRKEPPITSQKLGPGAVTRARGAYLPVQFGLYRSGEPGSVLPEPIARC